MKHLAEHLFALPTAPAEVKPAAAPDLYAELAARDQEREPVEEDDGPNPCSRWSDMGDARDLMNWLQKKPTADVGATEEQARVKYRELAILVTRDQLSALRNRVEVSECDGLSTLYIFDDALAALRDLQIPPAEVENGLTSKGLRLVLAKYVGDLIRTRFKSNGEPIIPEEDRAWQLVELVYKYEFTAAEMGLTEAQYKVVPPKPPAESRG